MRCLDGVCKILKNTTAAFHYSFLGKALPDADPTIGLATIFDRPKASFSATRRVLIIPMWRPHRP